MIDPLHEAIDTAAKDMLARCGKEIEGRPVPMSQQVEAFVAIVKWAETREKIKPPPPPVEKGETEFERIRREFSGKRRGRPPKTRPDVGEDERPGAAADEEPESPPAAANGATAADDRPLGSPAGDDEFYFDGGDE
jgi:hypothetical protein